MPYEASFSHLIGNEKIKKQLSTTLKKGAAGNSLLFSGIDGIGKSLFAYHFASLLVYREDLQKHQKKIDHHTHPDIRIYRPEGKTGIHSIQTMREFTDEVYMPPYESDCRVFIIHEADRMLSYSANALLKTFEEPALTSIIILLTSHRNAILPTILSRCRTYYFESITCSEIASYLQTKHNVETAKAEEIASQSKGSLRQALRYLTQENEAATTAEAHLLDTLAKGKKLPYKELLKAAECINNCIDAIKKETEATTKKEFSSLQEGLSLVQKQAIEKEIEGFVSMRYLQEATHLLEAVYAWYRDIQLLAVGANSKYMMHPRYHREIEQSLQRGEQRPLEEIQQVVADAKLAIERSTSLKTVFETIFLKTQLAP